jgi:hypothetical protein
MRFVVDIDMGGKPLLTIWDVAHLMRHIAAEIHFCRESGPLHTTKGIKVGSFGTVNGPSRAQVLGALDAIRIAVKNTESPDEALLAEIKDQLQVLEVE